MAISIYAIYQFATNSEYVWHFVKPVGYRKRGSGTYICPNHLAGFLEMLVPLGLTYTLTGRFGHLLRVFLGYASLIMLAGIGVTVSRGGWIATGVAFLFVSGLLIRAKQHRFPALLMLVLLASGGIAFYTNARQPQQRIKEMFDKDNPQESARFRFSLARPTIEMWLDHFWFGVGPAHYDYRFPAYRPVQVQTRPGHAHNDYLNALADWGAVGAALIGAAWFMLYAGVLRTRKSVSRVLSDLVTEPRTR